MKNIDKMLVAFLASANFFSVAQAEQYVQSLSSQDKNTLVAISQSSPGVVLTGGMADDFNPPMKNRGN